LILASGVLIFNVGGFFYKATQSTGIIRKIHLFLSLGFLCFTVFLSAEAVISDMIILIFARISLIISCWIVYLGLREEQEKPQEAVKKKIKVESDLFRISKRSDVITEEEVTFHKEKKICLVCKGKLSRSLYLCPKCDALYCDNCAHALANLENTCWVCNTPIAPTKPSKPYEKEEKGIIQLDISEKEKKRLK